MANYFKLIFRLNDLLDGEYAEAYAGGAAVALDLVIGEYADRVHINDLDDGVHAFWWAALHETDKLCRRIRAVPVNMGEWERQRRVFGTQEPDRLDLALATFFLNRSNRSGILTGGVIGGKEQSGKWKIDARFNKDNLIKRIEKIGRYRSRITLHNLDALDFIEDMDNTLPSRSLIYLDPPYYVAGKQALYTNYYEDDDHSKVAEKVARIDRNWIVSYDNVEPIRNLYSDFPQEAYGISYTAQEKYEGDEVVVSSKGLEMPDVENPSRIRKKDFRQLELKIAA